jgi:hypothetical protein
MKHPVQIVLAIVLVSSLAGSLWAADDAAPQSESSQSENVQSENAIPASTVGLPAKVEQLVLPGTELEPAPWDDK